MQYPTQHQYQICHISAQNSATAAISRSMSSGPTASGRRPSPYVQEVWLPHQLLGEIDRGLDQHQAGDCPVALAPAEGPRLWP